MLSLLTALASLKGAAPADASPVTAADAQPEPEQSAGPSGNCLQRLTTAPWSRLLLGDEPVPLVLLLVFALLLQPLVQGVELGLLLLLAGAAVLRAWLWCRGTRRDGEG